VKASTSHPPVSDLLQSTAFSPDEEPEAGHTPPPPIADVLRDVYEQDYEN
jgi:hypothetical protein